MPTLPTVTSPSGTTDGSPGLTELTGFGEVVHPRHTDRFLRRGRLPVTAAALQPFAEAFWHVHWRHTPQQTSEVIPNPVCHLTFEQGRHPDGRPLVRHGVTLPAAVITTTWTDRFTVPMLGEGRVFGLRFRPGGLAALLGRSLVADQILDADPRLPGAAALLPRLLAEDDELVRRELVESWLTPLAIDPPPDYLTVADLVEWTGRDSTVIRVEQLAERADVSARSLQRLFRHFLGVPPKWVLMRARLQDAAAVLDRDPAADQATVAVTLGWYDQSHFVRDFRRFLGVTPGEYARAAESPTAPTD